MTAAVSIPVLPGLELSDEDRALVTDLRRQMMWESYDLWLTDAYYTGQQIMTDLGVSMPPELRDLHVIIDWPRLAVDALHERMDIVGFRYPDSIDADQDLWDLWEGNHLDEEFPLACLDALVFGRSYLLIGTRDDGSPWVTVESPLNMTVKWDPRKRRVQAGLQVYDYEGDDYATLFTPDETVEMSRAGTGRWKVANRDRHRLGYCPIVRMANRQRTHDRAGTSEITPAVMSITDGACRKLRNLEVASEFYSLPQKYILGVTERAFQDASGEQKSAWETYIGRILALPRDENGDLPQVGQFDAYNPSVYTDVINMLADRFASVAELPASYLGKTTDVPASADAIRMSTDQLVQRVKRKLSAFGPAAETTLQIALGFTGGAARRPKAMWRNPEIPTPAATTDAVVKQIQSGYMPAHSDVAGEMLGYTPIQRRRIEADRRREAGRQALNAIAARMGEGGANEQQPGVEPAQPQPANAHPGAAE